MTPHLRNRRKEDIRSSLKDLIDTVLHTKTNRRGHQAIEKRRENREDGDGQNPPPPKKKMKTCRFCNWQLKKKKFNETAIYVTSRFMVHIRK